TPLAQWKPPARDPKQVHTFAGLLPNAESVGYSGWGLWDTANQGGRTFDPVMAAYYPESRKRFGFYDSLQDLAGHAQGNATYLVVGWFWSDQHDPLNVSPNPGRSLQAWKVAAAVQPRALADIATAVSPTAQAHPPVWDVNINVNAAATPPVAAQLDAIRRLTTRGGTVQLRSRQLETMKV